ncbi:hypothetical protein Trydic_g15334 [Trypoxylus dichotomus]
MWIKTKVVAVKSPCKSRENPRSYRPVSLLCCPLQLYENMIYNKISATVESRLVPRQAGFRPEKSSTSQVLNLTQCIEDGFEQRLKTGVVLIDLFSASNTVNVNRLPNKVYNMTSDQHLTNQAEEAIGGQSTDINNIEKSLNNAIQQLSDCCRMNQLRPNPRKTQTCLFHLDKRQAAARLTLEWDNIRLEHSTHPVYLGVPLDL